MIGSTRREDSGVRSVAFHPDGRTLFCGLDGSLKVYSWEPVICHDSIDMEWSTLGDLCIHDGKLLGGAYYENSVGVWVADVPLIEPYSGGVIAERNNPSGQQVELRESSLDRAGSHKRSTSGIRSLSPDDSKEIKTIYVDTAGGNSATSKEAGSISSPKAVIPSESNELSNMASQKQGSSLSVSMKTSGTGSNQSFAVPIIAPRDIPDGEEPIGCRRESTSTSRSSTAIPLEQPHMRKLSNGKFDLEKMSMTLESKSIEADRKRSDTDNFEDKDSEIKSVSGEFAETSTVSPSSDQENCSKAMGSRKGINAIKVVNGVVVVRGRTRSLVERFEKRERLNSNEIHTSDTITHAVSEAPKAFPLPTPDTTYYEVSQTSKRSALNAANVGVQPVIQVPKTSRLDTPTTATQAVTPAPKTSSLCTPRAATPAVNETPKVISSHTPDTTFHEVCKTSEKSAFDAADAGAQPVIQVPKTSRLDTPTSTTAVTPAQKTSSLHRPSTATPAVNATFKISPLYTADAGTPATQVPKTSHLDTPTTATPAVTRSPKTSYLRTPNTAIQAAIRATRSPSTHSPNMITPAMSRAPKTSPIQNSNQQVVEPLVSGSSDSNVIQGLMQSHDVLLSAFRSRLTKLQALGCFL